VLTLGSQAFKPREYYFHALGVLRRAGVLRLDTLFPGRLIGLLFPFFWCSPSGFRSGFQFLFSDCSLFLYLLGFIPDCDGVYVFQLFWTPFSLYEKHAMRVLSLSLSFFASFF